MTNTYLLLNYQPLKTEHCMSEHWKKTNLKRSHYSNRLVTNTHKMYLLFYIYSSRFIKIKIIE